MKKILKNSAALMAFFIGIAAYGDNLALGDDPVCQEPDHYIGYFFPGTGIGETPIPSTTFPTIIEIGLVDEFVPALDAVGAALTFSTTAIPGTDPSLSRPGVLLNPATKYVGGKKFKPQNPNTHYLVYPLTPSGDFTLPAVGQVATARVFNQFQDFNLDVATDFITTAEGTPFNPLIMVPSIKHACDGDNCALESEKSCPDCFPSGDHYLCYFFTDEFSNENAINVNARFSDQFQKNRQVDRIAPRLFCNPVQKTRDGQTSASNTAETNHMVCYETCERFLNPPVVVNWLNQFQQGSGFIESDSSICVPSAKIPLTFGIAPPTPPIK